jgi:hypothetical protein
VVYAVSQSDTYLFMWNTINDTVCIKKTTNMNQPQEYSEEVLYDFNENKELHKKVMDNVKKISNVYKC